MSAQAMLEALPLSTEEYGLACRRLTNAQHYRRYTEPGAAWYELRLVATSIQHAQPEGGSVIRFPAPPRSTRPQLRPASQACSPLSVAMLTIIRSHARHYP